MKLLSEREKAIESDSLARERLRAEGVALPSELPSGREVRRRAADPEKWEQQQQRKYERERAKYAASKDGPVRAYQRRNETPEEKALREERLMSESEHGCFCGASPLGHSDFRGTDLYRFRHRRRGVREMCANGKAACRQKYYDRKNERSK